MIRVEPAAFVLETERLVLRRPRAEDLAAVFALHSDPGTHPFGWTPDVSERESAERLDGWIAHWEAHGFGYWVVERRDVPGMIGMGGLLLRDLAEIGTVLNLYYRFTPSAWGRGYAQELARAAVDLARTYLPEIPVAAIINAENLPSIRVAEKVGLGWARRITYEGRERELYL